MKANRINILSEAVSEITKKSHFGADLDADLLKWSLTAARMGQRDMQHLLYTN